MAGESRTGQPQQSRAGHSGARGKKRLLSGPWALVEKILLFIIIVSVFLYIFNIHEYLRIEVYSQQFLAVWLGLCLVAVYIGFRPTKGVREEPPPWYDILLAAISLGMGIFACAVYPRVETEAGFTLQWWVAAISPLALLPVVEGCRRTAGWTLIIVAAVFLFYAKFAYLFPGSFYGRGLGWQRIATYIWLEPTGLYGIVLRILTFVILGFITLGGFFRAIGASDTLNHLASSSFGRYRGGAAKVAVVGSSLFGTISGSAMANVTTTGVMTIPMMKKGGYKPHVAGAIEACASTGGQLMPPVMGATAFLVAEFMQVPYVDVAIAAFVPALLYYIVVFFQVDLEAGKAGLKGLTERIPLLPVLKQAWLLVVIAVVLVLTLFILYWQPGKAAVASMATAVVCSQFRRSTRLSLRDVVDTLIGGGRAILGMAPMMGLAGFSVALLTVSGLGSIIGNLLLTAAGQHLAVMLLLTSLIATILGMGMATGGVYIILAITVAPALVQAGVPLMSAHLFIFYYGVLSMVTPPVCMATFAAAAIAESSMMRTGLTGSRIGFAAYIVPWIFVFSPALLLGQAGGISSFLIVLTKTAAGLFVLSVGLNGFLFRNIGWGRRILLILAGLGVLMPEGTGIPISMWTLTLVGAAAGLVILGYEWVLQHRTTLSPRSAVTP